MFERKTIQFLVRQRKNVSVLSYMLITKGPKGHISCIWVQCATLVDWLAWFSDQPEKYKLVKFHVITFSGFRGEVENVPDNQRPGQPPWISCRQAR